MTPIWIDLRPRLRGGAWEVAYGTAEGERTAHFDGYAAAARWIKTQRLSLREALAASLNPPKAGRNHHSTGDHDQ